ncbi:MAG: hypothetical protein ACXWU4_00750 [Allosphingosinicella sp.]
MEPAGRVGTKLRAEIGVLEVGQARRRLDFLRRPVGELLEPVLQLLDAVRARPVVLFRPAAGGEQERDDDQESACHGG